MQGAPPQLPLNPSPHHHFSATTPNHSFLSRAHFKDSEQIDSHVNTAEVGTPYALNHPPAPPTTAHPDNPNTTPISFGCPSYTSVCPGTGCEDEPWQSQNKLPFIGGYCVKGESLLSLTHRCGTNVGRLSGPLPGSGYWPSPVRRHDDVPGCQHKQTQTWILPVWEQPTEALCQSDRWRQCPTLSAGQWRTSVGGDPGERPAQDLRGSCPDFTPGGCSTTPLRVKRV